MQQHEPRSAWQQTSGVRWLLAHKMTLILLGFLAIGAFFVLTEQTAHVLDVLPYAIILLCPLMMLFMQRGHGGHGDHDQPHDEPPRGRQP